MEQSARSDTATSPVPPNVYRPEASSVTLNTLNVRLLQEPDFGWSPDSLLVNGVERDVPRSSQVHLVTDSRAHDFHICPKAKGIYRGDEKM